MNTRDDVGFEAQGAAVTVALAYHHAWTAHDLDAAMSYVADDVICTAPGTRLAGKPDFERFLTGFANQLTGHEMLAAFGDDTRAVLVYYPHIATVTDALTAELFTVTGGLITNDQLVFDRPSFAPPTK